MRFVPNIADHLVREFWRKTRGTRTVQPKPVPSRSQSFLTGRCRATAAQSGDVRDADKSRRLVAVTAELLAWKAASVQAASFSLWVAAFSAMLPCNSFKRFRMSSPEHLLSALQYWQSEG